MTQYVGCEHARELLDGLLDGELSMTDQLAVESHLRWCRTCALRVDDMRLIGASLRMGTAPVPAEHDASLVAMNEALLLRVRAEREQSLGVRVREMFTDMRLMWPALGATVAVVVCVTAVASVLQASAATRPESLAAMITALGTPGSERNPLRPAPPAYLQSHTDSAVRAPWSTGVSIPRLFDDDAKRAGGTLEGIPDDDLIYTVRTVVTRDGRVSNFEVLLSEANSGRHGKSAEHAGHDRAVFDALQQARFAPAYTPLGQAVAVDMVWVIAKTTAVVAPPAPPVERPRPKDVPKAAPVESGVPVSEGVSLPSRSTTA